MVIEVADPEDDVEAALAFLPDAAIELDGNNQIIICTAIIDRSALLDE